MSKDRNMVIPEAMLPPARIERVKGNFGEEVLLRNDAMFTAYRHSAGELSAFFFALADEGRIIANVCPSCGVVNCPPYQQRCPECNFTDMEQIEIKDVGVMAATPVITMFPPARFKGDAPFGTGYVFIECGDSKTADTALPLRVRTTQGMLRRGIFKRDTPIKIVFKDERQGEITDIFAVSQAELTREQIAKSPLLESDLEWNMPKEPEFEETEESKMAFSKILFRFQALALKVSKSKAAQKDLANWTRRVEVKSGGFFFLLNINDGKMSAGYEEPDRETDLILALEDPNDFLPYLERGAALTNLILSGKLWVSSSELETITRLDRLPRSLRKDGV